jgi:CubicO group peptidase (beta-lactamase class C family)
MMKSIPINRPTQLVALLWMIIVLLTGCSNSLDTVVPSNVSAYTPQTSTYWPTEAWRISSPEDQGMDSQKLEQLLDTIQQQRLNLHSLLVIRNGYLVSETYFKPYWQDTRHELYSCTKSFVSTLVGIAIDKGYIDGTDQRIIDFFPERTFANLDRQKEDMTLEDVLTMRSGLDWQEEDSFFRAMYQSPDWVKFVLDLPMVQPAGNGFHYCSGCSHLLSAILQSTTGMDPRDFAEQHLFKPLGISNAKWDTDADGIPIGGWGLQLTPRDMGKLGYLYLRGGQWEGQQIVSTGWVENATQTHVGTDGNMGYGYQWWTYPSLAAYTALGRDGQTIFVVPDSDLVIVTTADMDSHDEIFQLIEQFILPALGVSQKNQPMLVIQ